MSTLSDNALNVFVVDRNGIPILGAIVTATVKGTPVAQGTTTGSSSAPIRLQLSSEITSLDLKAVARGIEKGATVDANVGNYRFDFPEISMPQDNNWEKVVAVVFGIVFIATMLIIAIKFPNPTQYQYTTFRIVLALACAGVASVIPGVLNLNLGAWIRAGGALAVFVIVYFYSPAGLVTGKPALPNPTDPFTIYLVNPHGNELSVSSFQFPYSDIERNRSFDDIVRLLTKLPEQESATSTDIMIFRVNDEKIVAADGAVDATAEGNAALIVAPRSVIDRFGDQHLAFTYLHSKIPRG
jgi:hypothetical protein